jgi:hypothetical protein
MRKLIGLLFLVFIGLFVYFTFVKKKTLRQSASKTKPSKRQKKSKTLLRAKMNS